MVLQDIEWENVTNINDLTGFLQLAANSVFAAPTSYVSTPLTQGQAQQVDHLLSVETDSLAREVLLGLKREGMPSDAYISDFVSQFAEWGWDGLSSALALQVLANVRNSDWDEWLGHANSSPVETTAQDLGNDWIEVLVILDAKTGDTLHDVTGVELADGSQYVGLQETDVEELQELGLELIFVHNHPNGTEASYDDLKSAFDAGAKLLIVITPQGQEYVYIRGRYGMVEVRDEKASYAVGLENPEETEELLTRSEAQARKYLDDSPEYVFLQNDPEVIANMDVNPADVPRYRELEAFVNTSLAELQRLAAENPTAIDENIELLKNVFGYDISFYGVDVPLAEYYKEGSIEDKQSAMEQVHNLGTILFHFLNDLGFDIMKSTSEETRYILGADERIPKHQGLVVLPESRVKGDPDLKIVYLGSEIEAGTIGHEVAHEIDRRMGDYGTAKVEYEEGSEEPKSTLGPVGSFLWFLKNEVVNQRQPNLPKGTLYQGYRFLEAVTNLDEYSRVNFSKKEREVFADLLAAKVLGPLDEDFFATAFPYAKPIRFRNTKGSADIAIAMEQYFDDYAEYIGGDDSQKPEAFEYTKYHDQQTYDE